MSDNFVIEIAQNDVDDFIELLNSEWASHLKKGIIHINEVSPSKGNIAFHQEIPWVELIVFGESALAVIATIVGLWLGRGKKLNVRQGKAKLELRNMTEKTAKQIFKEWSDNQKI